MARSSPIQGVFLTNGDVDHVAGLLSLRERVTGGLSLSEAMRLEPAIYDELTLQMVSVGENSGTLDQVLDRLADFRERSLMFHLSRK